MLAIKIYPSFINITNNYKFGIVLFAYSYVSNQLAMYIFYFSFLSLEYSLTKGKGTVKGTFPFKGD